MINEIRCRNKPNLHTSKLLHAEEFSIHQYGTIFYFLVCTTYGGTKTGRVPVFCSALSLLCSSTYTGLERRAKEHTPAARREGREQDDAPTSRSLQQ